MKKQYLAAVPLLILSACLTGREEPIERLEWSGIYPHLAYFSDESECGTGAVVPWAERLWVVTYSPHRPKGSDNRLYEIDRALNMTIRPESIGGTPANRMIHHESAQLFIGPYAIDSERRVRVIPYDRMPGRHTANARHLTDPKNRIYYATMEEGFYEVDVRTMAVTELFPDANRFEDISGELLPGYHGKGCYSGQGRLVYANNGECSPEAMRRPDIPAGCLAEWDGKTWRVIMRNQFTEVTGPGGIYGNADPAEDPIWSIGWDHRSLLLMLLDEGTWRCFRLPKATHTYDGAHGWNTEWPRIREVGEGGDLLMTMHGMFWRFPRTFSAGNHAGLRPRSTYLKVIGDFCRWGEQLVFGCDDAAKSEFLNRRKAKSELAPPGRSQSNLWFADSGLPDRLGPPLGRGAVWVRDAVRAGERSDPYLFAGFERRAAHLIHNLPGPLNFEFEVNRDGNGLWQRLREVTVPASGYAWIEFPESEKGEWIRVRVDRDCGEVTVFFTFSAPDWRGQVADSVFDGLALLQDNDLSGGIIHAGGGDRPALRFAASAAQEGIAGELGYYEMGPDMRLRRVEDPSQNTWLKAHVAIPSGMVTVDTASVMYVDDDGRRFRLPKGDLAFDHDSVLGPARLDREVATERDLFNCHGTFYELPAENAGGFTKIRPITTHNRRIIDYCSWRGLLVMSGVAGREHSNRHIIRSDDGKCAVWIGVVDDLWKFGKAVGRGGPWKDTPVRADKPSDPYLMTGYDSKTLTLSHKGQHPVTFRIEVDVSGEGHWVTYRLFELQPEGSVRHEFPAGFQAYWIRVTSSADTVATAQLIYD